MIQIDCEKCQFEIQASLDRAGSRGKCPKCQTPYLIPAPSPSEKNIDDGALCFNNPVLNQMIQKFLSENQKNIERYSVYHQSGDNFQRLQMTMATGKSGDRTQTVSVHFQPSSLATEEIGLEDYPFLEADTVLVYSTIGEVTNQSDMNYALSFASSIKHSSIMMDNEFILRLCRTIPNINTLDPVEFPVIIREMAYWADQLEEVLFGVDKH
jgi:hypothetical protein